MSKGYPLQTIDDLEAEVLALKRLLWLRHGCSGPGIYGDDGEMQCNQCVIDFKRMTAEQIENRFMRINEPKLAELQALLHGPPKQIITNPDGSLGVKE